MFSSACAKKIWCFGCYHRLSSHDRIPFDSYRVSRSFKDVRAYDVAQSFQKSYKKCLSVVCILNEQTIVAILVQIITRDQSIVVSTQSIIAPRSFQLNDFIKSSQLSRSIDRSSHMHPRPCSLELVHNHKESNSSLPKSDLFASIANRIPG